MKPLPWSRCRESEPKNSRIRVGASAAGRPDPASGIDEEQHRGERHRAGGEQPEGEVAVANGLEERAVGQPSGQDEVPRVGLERLVEAELGRAHEPGQLVG